MKLSPWPLSIALLILMGLATSCASPQSIPIPPEDTVTEPSDQTAVEPKIAPNAEVSALPTNASEASPLTDTLIVPGERVGPITRTTTREDLASLFGEDRLSDESVHIGEGFTEPSTVINLGAEQSFTIVWQDDNRTQPTTVRDFGPAWKISEGIGVGSSLKELKATLGPFQLYGLGWDYQGTLVLEGSQLEQYYGILIVRVAPDPAAIAKNRAAYEAVLGDGLFPSNDPNLTLLDLKVDQLIVYLNGSQFSLP